MKSRITISLVLAVLGHTHWIFADTVVMTFDSVPITGPVTGISTAIQENGIKVTGFVSSANSLRFHTGTAFDTGHKAAEPDYLGSSHGVQIERPNGKPFDLISLTLSPAVANAAASIRVNGFKAGGGLVAQNFTTSQLIEGSVHTLASTFTNLSYVHVQRLNSQTNSNGFQIDDITIFRPSAISLRSPGTVSESAGNAVIDILLDVPSASSISLNYTINPGTATTPSDYTLPGGSATGTIVVPANSLSTSLAIPIVNDTTQESFEEFTVTLSGNPAGTSIATATGTVGIASDDSVTNFAGWMSAHDLSGNNALAHADPNNDGISNIESWLLRLNPAGDNPAAWLSRRATFSGGSADPGLTLFIPAPLPSDVRIVFSQSTTLDSWTEQTRRTGFAFGSLWTGSGSTRVVVSNTLSGRTVTLRASVPTGQRPQVFLRNTYEYVASSGGS